jgi:hypothetical protein
MQNNIFILISILIFIISYKIYDLGYFWGSMYKISRESSPLLFWSALITHLAFAITFLLLGFFGAFLGIKF